MYIQPGDWSIVRFDSLQVPLRMLSVVQLRADDKPIFRAHEEGVCLVLGEGYTLPADLAEAVAYLKRDMRGREHVQTPDADLSIVAGAYDVVCVLRTNDVERVDWVAVAFADEGTLYGALFHPEVPYHDLTAVRSSYDQVIIKLVERSRHNSALTCERILWPRAHIQ